MNANTKLRRQSLAGGAPPAVLLVGGMGTRLQSVLASAPKPLAPIGDVPFLELLVSQLRSQNISRLVMCTGYLANQIEEKFGDGKKWNVSIEFSKETQPLGTAGALKFAERYLSDVSDFVVMNGDSFIQMDFDDLIRFHREHDGILSMAVRKVSNSARYGTVQIDESNRVTSFEEKTGVSFPGLINAGVYVCDRAIFDRIPEGPLSLERDVFPRLLSDGIFVVEQEGMFIDIGTPEDYAKAQTLCRTLLQSVHSDQQ